MQSPAQRAEMLEDTIVLLKDLLHLLCRAWV
jgi:hypothetical protein